MLILGVDTSSRRGSVALLEGRRLVDCRPVDGEQDHSRALLPCVEALLGAAGRRVGELGALAVAVGPGSFTGLRVGLATVQGLALALARPCLGVDVLQAWARHESRRPLAVLLDAFRGEVLGTVCVDRLPGPARLASPAAFVESVPPGAWLAGGGAELHAGLLRQLRPDLALSTRPAELAASVAELAGEALDAGQRGLPEELRPVYLRAPAVLRG